jgi:phage terminase large subunit-like protein
MPILLDASEPTTAYARAVLDGEIIAGEFVRAACRRHLTDLERGAERGLVWRPEKAADAIGFYPAVLSVTAGAREGHPFELLDWHKFVAGNLFGWHRTNGLRRFKAAWLETGKGQAKSPFMAATGIYMLGFCGIPRAEIYAIASNRNQANVLFKDAVAMCRAQIPGRDEGETLEALQEGGVIIRGTADNAWKIEHPDSGSKFQALAGGEAVSGPRPCLVLADEIHEFRTDEDLRTWRAALAKMPGDSLMILGTNTPATDQIVGTDYSERFQKVVRGEVQDDSAFVYIARVDKDDKPFEDESCWVKALPALGVTFPADNVRTEVTTSLYHPPTYSATARLYFGIPGSSSSFWVSEDAWMAVQGRVDEKALIGLPCWLSLDLSEKNDLTALTAVWRRDDGMLLAKTWYWTPKGGIKERARDDNVPYEQWVAEGFLAATPGPTIDKTFVAERVAAICAEHDVQFLADDPSRIDDFIAACDEIGFAVWKFEGPDKPRGKGLPFVTHGQGPRVMFAEKSLCMPRSIEKFEDAILKQTIIIDDNKVTLMCAGNAMIDADRFNNRAFDKKKSRGRIDGMVTIAMAVGAANSEIAVNGTSISVFDLLARKANANPAQSDDDDEAILANPAHPRWKEARERWERKHMSTDDIWG